MAFHWHLINSILINYHLLNEIELEKCWEAGFFRLALDLSQKEWKYHYAQNFSWVKYFIANYFILSPNLMFKSSYNLLLHLESFMINSNVNWRYPLFYNGFTFLSLIICLCFGLWYSRVSSSFNQYQIHRYHII